MRNRQTKREHPRPTGRNVGRNSNNAIGALVLSAIVEGIGEWEFVEFEAGLAGGAAGDAVQCVDYVRVAGGGVRFAVLVGVAARCGRGGFSLMGKRREKRRRRRRKRGGGGFFDG